MEASDHRLVVEALAGRRASFRELYERHASAVDAFALHALDDVDAARSVTQDVFTALWTDLAKVAHSDAPLRPWLLQAARFRVSTALRSRSRRDEHGVPVLGALLDPEALVETRSLLDAIQRDVSQMIPLDAFVFRAVVEEGRPYSEVAHEAGISVDSVAKRLARVRARLRMYPGR